MEEAVEGVETAADTEAVETETQVNDDTAKWKAMARKHEREAEKLAKQLADIEASKMSDLERAQQQAQDAATRAEQAELRALRLEIASQKGLTPGQAKRLVGNTREELEADADEIVSEFATKPSVTTQSTGAGAVSETRQSDDPNTWLRRAVSNAQRRS